MFDLFGLPIRFYGITSALGIFTGAYVVARLIKREKLDPELIWDGLVWVIILGLVGARLYHVIDLWSYYSQNLLEIIQVWHGGLGIFGGIFGGLLGVIAFSRYRKLNSKDTLKILDLAVIGIPIGQAIGRFGNYFNQELYGLPSNLPWAITIHVEHRLPGYESVVTYHPLFFYESLLNIVLASVLWLVYRKKKVIHFKLIPGSLGYVGIYMIGYGVIRFCLEYLRIEYWSVVGVSVAQMISVAMVSGGSLLVWRAINNKDKNT